MSKICCSWWLACGLAFASGSAHCQTSAPEDGATPIAVTRIAVSPSPDARAAATGINAFALDLYKASTSTTDDLFLSPASISTAMGLAYRGAEGVTADQIRTVMHYPAAPRAYAAANGELIRAMRFSAPGRTLRVSDALWIQEGLPLRADYVADMASHFDAGLQQVDFAATETARARINQWVAGETANRIRALLVQDDISPDTKAVLVNTIYLKAEWEAQFDAKATHDAPFTLLDGKKVSTPLMTQRASFRVIEERKVQAIAMPYKGRESEMVILLPQSPHGLPAFEAELTTDRLEHLLQLLAKSRGADTFLTMPRFHREWRTDLASSLSAMGMPSAMGDEADFGGMKEIDPNSANSNLWGVKISKVIHQANIDVDENGSEAAAATAVIMEDVIVTGMRRGPPPPPPIIFRADRPFLFLIRDTRTGVILFMGRVANKPG